jgi:hypothetical protein
MLHFGQQGLDHKARGTEHRLWSTLRDAARPGAIARYAAAAQASEQRRTMHYVVLQQYEHRLRKSFGPNSPYLREASPAGVRVQGAAPRLGTPYP